MTVTLHEISAPSVLTVSFSRARGYRNYWSDWKRDTGFIPIPTASKDPRQGDEGKRESANMLTPKNPLGQSVFDSLPLLASRRAFFCRLVVPYWLRCENLANSLSLFCPILPANRAFSLPPTEFDAILVYLIYSLAHHSLSPPAGSFPYPERERSTLYLSRSNMRESVEGRSLAEHFLQCAQTEMPLSMMDTGSCVLK